MRRGFADLKLVGKYVPALLLSLAVSSCVVSKDGFAPPTPSNVISTDDAQRHFEHERRWGPRGENEWEPVVAADPSSSWIYQMTTKQRPDALLFRASPDGGTSWLPTGHICRNAPHVPFQYDPQIATTRTGTIDAICLDGFAPGVVFTQSQDHGHTWSAAVRLDRPLHYSDKPILVVSPSGKDLYVAFNAGYALYVSASHDAGASWQTPVKATSAHLWYYAYSGTMAPDGSVWFAVDGEAGRNQTGDGYVQVVSSRDGGATWKTFAFALSQEGAPCYGHDCYPDFYTAQDAIAVDRGGAFLFVFAKSVTRQGPNALYESRSADGVRWTPPAPINHMGNSTSPQVAAGLVPGDFRLVWQDDRNGPRAWNTWFSRSSNGGKTWSAPVRLSDRGSGERYKNRAGYDFPFGDYLGLAVDRNGRDHVIWGEGEHIYYPGSTWWTHD